MLIRSFKDIEAAGNVVSISHGKSTAVRVLVKSDQLGFSLSEARCGAGNRSKLWYKNHWEANYIRAGKGSLLDRQTGERWDLYPGVIYCVGPDDQHSVENTDDPLRIVSIFNPPIEGNESHDEDGAFPATGTIPPGQERMFVRNVEQIKADGGAVSVVGGNVTSVRLLTAKDQLGFSVNDVYINAGQQFSLWYKYHWEANLIIEGNLEITDLVHNQSRLLGPGDVYCVGPEDKHQLKTITEVHLLAVFNPPLNGDEVHDEDGAYPANGEVPHGPPHTPII